MKLFQIIKKRGFIFLPLLIVLIFFYKSIIYSQIPFPGDLLVGHYEPYRSQIYFGYGVGGVPHKAQGPDVIKQLIPWKHFVIETLKSGQVPFWNPYNFSGNPQMAKFYCMLLMSIVLVGVCMLMEVQGITESKPFF